MVFKPGMKVRFILKGPDKTGVGYVDEMKLIVAKYNGILTLGPPVHYIKNAFLVREDKANYYKWHASWFEPLEPEDKEKALVEKIQQLWERQPYVQQLRGLDISF